jgi:hypothetical protein
MTTEQKVSAWNSALAVFLGVVTFCYVIPWIRKNVAEKNRYEERQAVYASDYDRLSRTTVGREEIRRVIDQGR